MRDVSSTLYDELFRMRDAYRNLAKEGIAVVHGDELGWEETRQGRLKWFVHPAKPDTVIKNVLVWEQEIAPGSRSGKQHLPGGIAHYVLEGAGYSVIDGERHPWKAGDAIGLPLKPEGVVCQHFNPSANEPVRLLAIMPNLFDALGVDLGSRFEQIEDAP
jgi:gentisate 1,2-dioxygenase